MASIGIKLNPEQERTIVRYVQNKIQNFPRDILVERMEEYERSFHLQTENPNQESDEADDKVGYYRYKDLDIGVVKTVGEADHAFYVSTLLSENPIFPVTSTNKNKDAATMMNTKLESDQRFVRWDSALTKSLLAAAKYNLCAAEVNWEQLKSTHVGSDVNGDAELKESNWAGNVINYISPYNLGFDTTVPPDEVATKGDWAGYTQRMTQIRLWEYLRTLKAVDPEGVNETDEMWTSTYNGQIKFEPIYPEGNRKDKQSANAETNWSFEFGLDTVKDSKSKDKRHFRNTYVVWTVYVRLIPSLQAVNSVPNPNEPQIWKLIIVNGSHIVAAFLQTDYHRLLNIIVAQANPDAMELDTHSPSGQVIPMQKTIKQLLDRGFAYLDRNISDRAIIDERYIKKEDANSRIPDAKIPLRTGAPQVLDGGNPMERAYKQIPFDTRGIDQVFNTISMLIEFSQFSAGINRAQLGHFVKGNKTREEFTQIMSNANSKQFLRALMLAMNFLNPMKLIIKTNILQYAEQETATSAESGERVDIDPMQIRNASLEFKLLDGLNPRAANISPEFYEFFIRMAEQIPTLNQRYAIEDMVVHMTQLAGGVNMKQYERDQPLPAQEANPQGPGNQPTQQTQQPPQ